MKNKQLITLGAASLLALGTLGSLFAIPSGRKVLAEYTSTHTFTLSGSSASRPSASGAFKVEDEAMGLHSGGYVMIETSGTGDLNYNAGGSTLFLTSYAKSATGEMSLAVDVYANGITAVSLTWNYLNEAFYSTTPVNSLIFYANGYGETEGSPLGTISATQASISEVPSGSRHVKVSASATGASTNFATMKPRLLFETLTVNFTC